MTPKATKPSPSTLNRFNTGGKTMDNLNNPTQATMSCPLCCAKNGAAHSAGCKNAAPPRITMTPLLRRALEDWARNCENTSSADAALLDLLNLMAGPNAPPPASYPPAGMVLLPVEASNAIAGAIEDEIDRQLEESGIEPSKMSRQDADRVWDEAILAAKTKGGT